MIDVHVARMSGYNQKWFDECMGSLQHHPIRVHLIDGVAGDVRQMRFQGFLCGTSEYVSFVDPDDMVLPDVYEHMYRVLEADPKAVGAYCLSEVIDADGTSRGLLHPFREYTPKYLASSITEIHQLVVMRRAVVLDVMRQHYDFIPKMGGAEIILYALMAKVSHWVAVDFVGYKWRLHQAGVHKTAVDRSHHLKLIRQLHQDLCQSASV